MSHARTSQATRPSQATRKHGVSGFGRTVAAVSILLWATPAPAASLVDPLYRFRRLPTEHFVVYFHQGEDHLAARLAVVAEDTWHKLERPLGTRPPPLTHVVLVDQTEVSNGFAFPLPRNTILINAVWPAGSTFIGALDDWLTLAFTHEFTHIVHLDRSEGWARVVRRVFGRVGLAFPNLFLPQWQTEGLATYEESAITGEGRLHAGDFRAVVTEAARARRLEPIDRVNGGLIDWPDGFAPYAYGLGFHAYLAEHYGEATLAALARDTSRRIPYLASRAFLHVYGRSLGELWREYQRSVMASVPAFTSAPDRQAGTQLTHHGFSVLGPRFVPPACAGCAPEVVYSVRTPHGFPTLNHLALDGSASRRLANRFLGSTTAIGRHTLYFDQLQLRRNVGLYSDLYALDRTSLRVRRLTSGARLIDPDLSPDEQTLVAVQVKPGQRDLVLVRLAAATRPRLATRAPSGSRAAQGRLGGAAADRASQFHSQSQSQSGAVSPAVAEITTLISETETQFNAPRWSPDGRTIAVERHRLGAQPEIVIVDVATRAVRRVASDPHARWVTPAWRPDGRAIVAAADLHDGPFDLYELAITSGGVASSSPPRRLTDATGGAIWPDVSPDGTSIVYVGYTAAGFDLFQTPYRTAADAPEDGPPDASRDVGRGGEAPVPPTPRSTDAYAPGPTLAPTAWWPIVTGDHTRWRIGAAAGGADVLRYHGYGVSVSWLVSRPRDAPAVDATTPDWQVSYVYDRWRPTWFASASRDTSFFAGPPSDTGVPATATLRERQVQAGVIVPLRRVRVLQTLTASVVRAADDFTFSDHVVSRDRTAVRGAWSIASANTYGYSISPERGVAVGITAEAVRRALGASADATAFTADARAYLPGLAPQHVLAIRAAGGASRGDRDVRRAFDLGGAVPNRQTVDFSREALSLMRGFPADTFAGTHVALVNADYRWPIARPQRGAGTWPLFLQTIHAAVFADAGHAWTRAFNVRDVKTSAGGELSIDVAAAYGLPLTATIGAAWGHDGSHTVSDRATVYVRLGRAF